MRITLPFLQSDPLQEIIKVAFENGINMFDTAEGYAAGRSELEMQVVHRESRSTTIWLIVPLQGTSDQGIGLPEDGPDHHDQAFLGSVRAAERHGSVQEAVSGRSVRS